MYIHVPVQPQISPKAMELGAKIAELVRILREKDPSIGRADVEQGISLAQAELRKELGGRSAGPQLRLILGVAVIAMLGAGIGAFSIKSEMGGGASMLWVITGLAIGLPVVGSLLLLLRKPKA